MTDESLPPYNYGLGFSQDEQDRLRAQSAHLRSLTYRFFREAGIRAGMRVLELGAGLGDMTKLLIEMIGPTGEIVSLDQSPVMLAQARKSVEELATTGVRFVECDLNRPSLHFDRPFDALVGRLILTHLENPVRTLRILSKHVRPGGLVAFQEADFTLSDHLLSLHRDRLKLTYEVCEWIKLARTGTTLDPQMGLHLYPVFRQAGLPPPRIYVHTEVYGGACASRIHNTVAMIRNFLPRLERLGLTADRIGLATLEDRLTSELTAADAVQAFTSIASAWAIKEDAGIG